MSYTTVFADARAATVLALGSLTTVLAGPALALFTGSSEDVVRALFIGRVIYHPTKRQLDQNATFPSLEDHAKEEGREWNGQ